MKPIPTEQQLARSISILRKVQLTIAWLFLAFVLVAWIITNNFGDTGVAIVLFSFLTFWLSGGTVMTISANLWPKPYDGLFTQVVINSFLVMLPFAGIIILFMSAPHPRDIPKIIEAHQKRAAKAASTTG